MKIVTVFVGCDFYGMGPRKALDRFLRKYKDKDVQVLPIFSCSTNSEVIRAFGRRHPDFDAMVGSHGMMGRIYALIKNSDFVIFDLTGYRPGRMYCLNVIYELGIALPFAKEIRPGLKKKLTWRFFAKKGLRYHKDISDLSGDQPLFYGYKDFDDMKAKIEDNLIPLIFEKQGGRMSRKRSVER